MEPKTLRMSARADRDRSARRRRPALEKYDDAKATRSSSRFACRMASSSVASRELARLPIQSSEEARTPKAMASSGHSSGVGRHPVIRTRPAMRPRVSGDK